VDSTSRRLGGELVAGTGIGAHAARRLGDNPGMNGAGFLDAAARQASAALDVSRRPWPLPEQPWAQSETREDVLLAHWAVPPPELTRLLPPELTLDTFGGEAWLGVVAFRVRNLRLRGLPPLPGLSSLLELEVRTYVTDGVRPGIWLFSLEASNRLLVEAAKRTHRLPAYRAQISLEADGGALALAAERDGRSFRGRYEPSGRSFSARQGTLECFLSERFALYTADGGRLYRAELHHSPWRVRRARALIEASTLVPLVLEGEPRALAAARQDMLVWPLEEL
jgi:uncharacterized protein YqjF (DUF2071 family)